MRFRSALAAAAVLTAWGYAGVGLLGILLWLLSLDSHNSYLVVATVLAPFWLIPAYPLCALGLMRRRYFLGAASVLLVIAQLATVRMVIAPSGSGSRGPVAFRLLDANLQYTNRDTAALATQIDRIKPDVVTLEELTPTTLGPLKNVLRAYPYRVERVRQDAEGVGIYSKLPITKVSVTFLGANPLIHATVGARNSQIAMIVVHTNAPQSDETLALWHEQFRQLAVIASTLPADGMMVGDFNATLLNRPMRHVLSVGHLRDGALSAGAWWPRTWARNLRVIPPLIEIDHMLTGTNIGTREFHIVSDPGSDHQVIWSDITVGK